MGRLIEEPKVFEVMKHHWLGGSIAHHIIDDIRNDIIKNVPTAEAIPIPQDATNEDVLRAVFPNDAEDIIKYIKIFILNGWLNSKYERNEDGFRQIREVIENEVS